SHKSWLREGLCQALCLLAASCVAPERPEDLEALWAPDFALDVHAPLSDLVVWTDLGTSAQPAVGGSVTLGSVRPAAEERTTAVMALPVHARVCHPQQARALGTINRRRDALVSERHVENKFEGPKFR